MASGSLTPMEEPRRLGFDLHASTAEINGRRRRPTMSSKRSTTYHGPSRDVRLQVPVPEEDESEEKPDEQPHPVYPGNMLEVDESLRGGISIPQLTLTPSRAHEYEQAISDGGSESGSYLPPMRRIKSSRRDRWARGRSRDVRSQDRSHETSAERSISPANSVEAFADLQRHRTLSHATGQRPNLSSLSVLAGVRSRAPFDQPDHMSFTDEEEPGKTYTVDFEELEEFVALSKQGKIDCCPIPSVDLASRPNMGFRPTIQAYNNQDHGSSDVPNVVLNGETFNEKLPKSSSSSESSIATRRIPRPEPAGFKPDRFTFFSTDVQQPCHGSTLGDLLEDGSKFCELFDLGSEGGVWWLDVLNPTRPELDVLASAFRIHRLTKEDIETQEAREKVELFSHYYFVCFRSFNMNKLSDDFLRPIQLYIVVTNEGVLSFSYTPHPHANNVRSRISKLGDFVSLGPDYICYAMIDNIVDSFAPMVRSAERESQDIEDQVYTARDQDFGPLLRQVGECRKRVLNLMRLLGGKADVIKGFTKRCTEEYEMAPRGDISLYLGDIQDHVTTMMHNLTHVENLLSRSHGNYFAQLNVDYLLKGDNINKGVAKLTVVATVLVPLNLVTGLWGMNVHVPGQNADGLYWFFSIITVVSVFIGVGLWIARRYQLL